MFWTATTSNRALWSSGTILVSTFAPSIINSFTTGIRARVHVQWEMWPTTLTNNSQALDTIGFTYVQHICEWPRVRIPEGPTSVFFVLLLFVLVESWTPSELRSLKDKEIPLDFDLKHTSLLLFRTAKDICEQRLTILNNLHWFRTVTSNEEQW